MSGFRLASLHLGKVQEYQDADGTRWRSAIAKQEVPGPVFLSRTGPLGDELGDHRHHGGEQQAVMAYSRVHHDHWKAQLGLDIPPGGLGENLSLQGLDDSFICIGDRFALGGAEIQVSQPRQPCRTLSRFWKCPELLQAIWESARSGWYFRVILEGEVTAGQELQLLERPHPEWSVARTLQALYQGKQHPEEARAAAQLAALSPGWQAKLRTLGGR